MKSHSKLYRWSRRRVCRIRNSFLLNTPIPARLGTRRRVNDIASEEFCVSLSDGSLEATIGTRSIVPKPGRRVLVLTMTTRVIWLREHVIGTRIYTASQRKRASYPSTPNIAQFLGHLAVALPHLLLGGFTPHPPHTTTF